MTAPPSNIITLDELKKSGGLPNLIREVMNIGLTDPALTLVKATGLKPGDNVWRLVTLDESALRGKNVVRDEKTVIHGIRRRLEYLKLRFGTLTQAVYKEIGVEPPDLAPEEPVVPSGNEGGTGPSASEPELPKASVPTAQPRKRGRPPKQRDAEAPQAPVAAGKPGRPPKQRDAEAPPATPVQPPQPPPPAISDAITLTEAIEQAWLPGLASPIEILEYPVQAGMSMIQNGIRYIWQVYEREIVFLNGADNATLWRKIGKLGLPSRRKLADDLVEELKRVKMFEPPASEPEEPRAEPQAPAPVVPPEAPASEPEPAPAVPEPTPTSLRAPTQAELDTLRDELQNELYSIAPRKMILEGARNELEQALQKLAGLVSYEPQEPSEAVVAANKKIAELEARIGEIHKLTDALDHIEPVIDELTLVLAALNR